MKKKLFLITVILCLGIILLTACNSTIEAPANIKLNERELTWDAVDGADSYKIKINDKTFDAKTNSFKLPNDIYGEISVNIATVANGNTSDFAETKVLASLQLAEPQNIKQVGNKIVWDCVTGATGYVVKINGAEYATTNNEFVLENNNGGTVQVLATGSSDGTVKSSLYSEKLTLKKQLSTPTEIKEVNGLLTWEAVDDADKYLVTINGNKTETTINNLNIKYLYSGDTKIEITALSNDENLLNSEVAKVTLNIEKVTLNIPKNIKITDGVLTFDTVDGATAYEIYGNGKKIAKIDTTTFELKKEILDEGGYIQIVAVSDVCNPSAKSEKIFLRFTEINTEEDLRNMKEMGCYKLMNDITLSGNWIPKNFKGVFDGNSHTIENIVIEKDGKAIGFFGVLEGASVKNVILKGKLNVTSAVLESNAGGIAGFATDSMISNCNVEMDINYTSTNGLGIVGGIAGVLENTSIYKTNYKGEILTDNATVGGFIGKARNPKTLNTIEKCIANATIEVKGGEQAIVGGFIGMMTDNTLTVTECKADCNIIGNSYVGGFVGYMGSGKIDNSYSVGTAVATHESLVHLGGFIGRLEGYNSLISNALSQCKVSCESSGEYVSIGGFVGHTVGGSFATVYDNCYYDNTINPIDRIGNSSGRGDGITAKSTEDLKSIEALNGFDSTKWILKDGDLPKLSIEQ